MSDVNSIAREKTSVTKKVKASYCYLSCSICTHYWWVLQLADAIGAFWMEHQAYLWGLINPQGDKNKQKVSICLSPRILATSWRLLICYDSPSDLSNYKHMYVFFSSDQILDYLSFLTLWGLLLHLQNIKNGFTAQQETALKKKNNQPPCLNKFVVVTGRVKVWF